ncbi:MAG TPA: hypothetical protein VGC65_10615 [Bacteroidia bacterium]|jgi:hypothetical protein
MNNKVFANSLKEIKKMRIAVLLIIAVLMSANTSYAGNDKKINAVISKQLQVPAALKNKELNEKVNVQFKITSNGKATVLNVETSNAELKNYICNQFPKMDFNTVAEKQDAVYFIDINFKVL